jgi:arginase family enzyme
MPSSKILMGGGDKRIALLGVPYDSPTSLGRPGARYAPERIRGALRWNLGRVKTARSTTWKPRASSA